MNVTALNILQATTQRTFRLEITLPKMDVYSVEKVMQIIAATSAPFSCGKFCSECEISSFHEKKRMDPYKYDCEGLFRRHQVLRYLCLQLKKLVDLGRFHVWDSELYQEREFPWSSISNTLSYKDFQNWTRSSFIFSDDLLVFLSSEKIRARFVTYSTDSNGGIAIDLCADEQQRNMPELPIENSVLENREALAQNITVVQRVSTAEATRNRPQRFDFLAVEIDEMLSKNPEMTPTLVWRALIAKIGSANTCVQNVIGAGLRWKNAKGELAIASASNVADRVTRWKNARK